MKRALLSSLALLFLAFFLMPAQANAHGLEQHVISTQSASQMADTTYDKVDYTLVKAIPAENSDQGKSCNGQCCSNAACCVAILSHADLAKPQPLHSLVSPMALSGLAPLGPPYPLFRPPRQIV
jgi:hypothetical protein